MFFKKRKLDVTIRTRKDLRWESYFLDKNTEGGGITEHGFVF